MRRIGIYIERQRAWGRRVCEGIASFAQAHPEWQLHIIERSDIARSAVLRTFDGIIARIADARTAAAFRRSGKPVADMTVEFAYGGNIFAGVRQDNAAIGRLAAEHFIEHRFVNFAFLGYSGARFSRERRDSYAEFLKQRGYACSVHEMPYGAHAHAIQSGRMDVARGSQGVARWLRALPKPCAVFCATDLCGYQASRTCGDEGLAVPDAVALLGVDNDTLICNFINPTLSSIDPDAFRLGVEAAELLNRYLDGTTPPGAPPKIPPHELVARGSTQTFPVDPPWLSDALVFIRRNHHRHISANDVYSHLKLSHTRVNAAFRERLGTTVQQEIRSVSLAEARRLLGSTDLPVVEIARRTGFASAQYFCNVFTATYGASPSSWRHHAHSAT